MRTFSDQPYRFYPPKYRPAVASLLRWMNRLHVLPRQLRIRRLEVRGEQPVLDAVANGDRLLFLPNHSTHADGAIVSEAMRRVGIRPAFMAAYDGFLHSRFQAWALQSLGGFSVDRQCCDRRALKQADAILRKGPFALTIFPEGQVYLQNDDVTPFIDGALFTAVSVARKMADSGPRVLAVPVSIKATFAADVRPQVRARMCSLAAEWKVPIGPDKTPRDVLRDVGEAALSRRLLDLGIRLSASGRMSQQIEEATNAMLAQLNEEVDVQLRPGEKPIDGIRQVRRIAHATLLDPERAMDHAAARDLSERATFAWRITSYSGHYVAKYPSVDRISETLEKLEEDAHGYFAEPTGDRHAVLQFGAPIDVGAQLAAGVRPRQLIGHLTDHVESAVQIGLDEINARNTCAGSELWSSLL